MCSVSVAASIGYLILGPICDQVSREIFVVDLDPISYLTGNDGFGLFKACCNSSVQAKLAPGFRRDLIMLKGAMHGAIANA